MADERKPTVLGPGALTSLLAKLDDVMAEAARLRDEVSRQLSEQRGQQQQKITSPPPSRKPRPRKR
jgi:hypothetical protein